MIKGIKEGLNVTGSLLGVITGSIYLYPGLASLGTAFISWFYFVPKINLFNVIITVVLPILTFIITSLIVSYRHRKKYSKLIQGLTKISSELNSESKLFLNDFSHQIGELIGNLKNKEKPSVNIIIISQNSGLDITCNKIASNKEDVDSINKTGQLLHSTNYTVILNKIMTGSKELFYYDNNITNNENFQSSSYNAENGFSYQSLITVPISENDTILGFVNLESKRKKYFTKNDIFILSFFINAYLTTYFKKLSLKTTAHNNV